MQDKVERDFSNIVESISEPAALHKIILDSRNFPVDYVCQEINSAYEKLFNVKRNQVINKKASELLPRLKARGGSWLDTFAKAALTEQKNQIESYSSQLKRWFEITAYQVHPGYFITIYKDINKFKQVQQANRSLLSILDNIDALIYVADLQSYEIIYMNQYGKKIWGDAEGKKCWQVIQKDQTGPCKFCTNGKLLDENGEPAGTVKWEVFNTINNRWYECRDTAIHWIDGRLARLEIATDITERKEIEDRVRYYSFRDQLTGLYNRHYFEEELKRLDTERQLPLGVIVADINDLKLVNDIYGYAKGDKFITGAAKMIKKSCRSEDIVTRWGGDEFVILLPQVTSEELQAVVERLHRNSLEMQINDLPFSMAFGTALKSRPEQSMIEFLQTAEKQMRSNKNAENKVVKANLLKALYKQLEQKSNESVRHIKRLRSLSLTIGKGLNLSKEELNKLSSLSVLHDIGLIQLVEDTLLKTDNLSVREWSMIKEHPREGWKIARATRDYAHIAEDILSHHEWWDGSGYPRGLKGEEIPLLARIIAIADAYEVMTGGRPYKKALSQKQALRELKKAAGTQFDPELVKLFIKDIAEGKHPCLLSSNS